VRTTNGSAFVSWDTPKFTDNQAVSTLNIQKPSLSPGQALHWGTYEINYIAYDDAGNSATCAFKIYVVKSFCPPLDPPEGGTQSCEDWGPGGIFKVCRIKCEEGKKFSQPVPQFYTCGAEGFWRPNPNKNPASQFVYPACSAATPAQKIFKIKLQYLAQVLCSTTGKGVLKEKIITALQGLNEEWKFSACDKISKEECKGFDVDVNCVKKSKNKVKRQAPEVDQKYDLEISFPTFDGEDAININNGRREKIERLLQEIILDENNLNIDNTLPGTLLDRTSVDISSSFSCPPGSVVIDNTCVPCPHGTFYDDNTGTCGNCPIGFYSAEEAQLTCSVCPEINGVPGTTENEGSTRLSDCKETCPAGRYYDKVTGLCRPCGNGRYQMEEGKFFCYMCGVGLTTRNTEALTRDECRPECEDGHQIDLDGQCIPCQLGQYRKKGVHLGCQACPKGFTTSKSGSSEVSDCSLPICLAGQYLNASTNVCTLCPRGSYQPDDQQTECISCDPDTTTKREGATDANECTNRCKVGEGEAELCDKNAICYFNQANNTHKCECKRGYVGSGENGDCTNVCEGRCKNQGTCVTDELGNPFCQCVGSFTGDDCETKSEFAYIAGGIAGAIIFLILLVLLVWMICVRATRPKKQEKVGLGPGAEMGHQGGANFYYGAPAPYAESIAPSHHSTYAHYYDDEEDGWDMPNFYNEGYMKDGLAGKMNSLARSNASLYGNKEELYDRLRRHAYQGGKKDKNNHETTSDSDDGRHA